MVQEALVTEDGQWRCPSCKRFVAQSKGKSLGECKCCGESLLFIFRGMITEKPELETLVNFDGYPKLLNKLNEYAKLKGLTFSETVIGFAARGYRDIFDLEKDMWGV